LALRLHRSLWSWRWWLINARILVSKSEQHATISQTTLNPYYPHLRCVGSVPIWPGWIKSIWQYVQTSLQNLWNGPLVSGWKFHKSLTLILY
jgi:hypothetical protein